MKQRLYTYYPKFDADDYLEWHVYESTTEQVIDSFFFEDEAQNYTEFLENGGAFAGFTPSFIIKKTHLGDINTAFASEFATD